MGIRQSGGIAGPDGAVTHYDLQAGDDGMGVVVFHLPVSPMYAAEIRHAVNAPYDIAAPEGGWRAVESFTPAEKAKLRPMAETLAMLDGNAFFGNEARDGHDWYEMYLPEAAALYESNGGDDGWAGYASFAKPTT